ncbi:MAG: phosphoribosylformylglycinamidine synthase subunit PurL [Vampirovibrionales bacterium]|nr:phosphoribosylformylglycinamidine synthase subunit PurL [Vampirovibrionales bacterium]
MSTLPISVSPITPDATLSAELLETLKALNLRESEYHKICQHLKREPNKPELYMFSALWSEHCSYKHTKPLLKKLPTQGPMVVLGPGENAGIVQIGPHQVAFKVESHNHPTAIEPYQGAATGVGGILRDIITLNARPVALLNALRFGTSDPEPTPQAYPNATQRARNAYLLKGAVAGIADYGNCMGIPTLAGDTFLAPWYTENPLVNAMALGVLAGPIMPSGISREDCAPLHAAGINPLVVYAGAPTGRDGLGGAAFASRALETEKANDDRPAVQVGDPFMGKRLLESCLEAFALKVNDKKAVLAAQDMGAAGLACALAEMSDKAGLGMRLDLDKVPIRQSGLEPHEFLLSETQERMLLVVAPDKLDALLAVFKRHEVPACVIGEVTQEPLAKAYFKNQCVVNLPPALLTSLAPVYPPANKPDEPERLKQRRERQALEALQDLPALADLTPEVITPVLNALLDSSNLRMRDDVWGHYDRHVGNRTLQACEHGGAGVLALEAPEHGDWSKTHRVATCLEGNPRHVALEPFTGTKGIVAFCARKLATTGATPIAVTNNLNFGDPEAPETEYQLGYSVEGIKQACEVLKTPVTGGNVSLYNVHGGRPIEPSPTIGMVGHIAPGVPLIPARVNPAEAASKLKIALLGRFKPSLGGSEYQWLKTGEFYGAPPSVALADEARLSLVILPALAQAGLIQAARSLSLGGLWVGLHKFLGAMPLSNTLERPQYGGKFNLAALLPQAKHRTDVLLFGESHGSVLIAYHESDEPAINAILERHLPSVGTVSELRLTPLGGVLPNAPLTLDADTMPV